MLLGAPSRNEECPPGIYAQIASTRPQNHFGLNCVIVRFQLQVKAQPHPPSRHRSTLIVPSIRTSLAIYGPSVTARLASSHHILSEPPPLPIVFTQIFPLQPTTLIVLRLLYQQQQWLATSHHRPTRLYHRLRMRRYLQHKPRRTCQ